MPDVLSCVYVCVDHYLPYPLSWVLSCVWHVELRLCLCWSLSPLSSVLSVELCLTCWAASMSVLIIIFLILCPECWAVSDVLSCVYVCVDHYLPYPLSWELRRVWCVELHLCLCWSLSSSLFSVLSVEACLTCWAASMSVLIIIFLILCPECSAVSDVLSCVYVCVDLHQVPWLLDFVWYTVLRYVCFLFQPKSIMLYPECWAVSYVPYPMCEEVSLSLAKSGSFPILGWHLLFYWPQFPPKFGTKDRFFCPWSTN